MYTYHPKSWSQQAREMCDSEVWQVNNGWQTIKGAIRFFSISYRHPLIHNRAAKRFGRMRRAGKVHNNFTTYYEHYPEEAPH